MEYRKQFQFMRTGNYSKISGHTVMEKLLSAENEYGSPVTFK